MRSISIFWYLDIDWGIVFGSRWLNTCIEFSSLQESQGLSLVNFLHLEHLAAPMAMKCIVALQQLDTNPSVSHLVQLFIIKNLLVIVCIITIYYRDSVHQVRMLCLEDSNRSHLLFWGKSCHNIYGKRCIQVIFFLLILCLLQ